MPKSFHKIFFFLPIFNFYYEIFFVNFILQKNFSHHNFFLNKKFFATKCFDKKVLFSKKKNDKKKLFSHNNIFYFFKKFHNTFFYKKKCHKKTFFLTSLPTTVPLKKPFFTRKKSNSNGEKLKSWQLKTQMMTTQKFKLWQIQKENCDNS